MKIKTVCVGNSIDMLFNLYFGFGRKASETVAPFQVCPFSQIEHMNEGHKGCCNP